MSSAHSIVEYFSENSGSSCGYCKGKSSSYSHGLWGHVLTPSDYQDMIDRGWRRSGKYCYKPTMNKTCCPQYPIRCDVSNFHLRKSHKKVIKRFRNFIIKDIGSNRKRHIPPLPATSYKTSPYDSDEDIDSASDEDGRQDDDQMQLDSQKAEETENKLKMNNTSLNNAGPSLLSTSETIPTTAPLSTDSSGSSGQTTSSKTSLTTTLQEDLDVSDGKSKKGRNTKASAGPDPNKPPARKAKDIRRERALLKQQKGILVEKGLATAQNNSEAVNDKLLDELTDINSFPKDGKHKLEIRLLNAQSSDSQFMESFQESFEVYRKYQVTVHGDKPEKCSAKQFKRFLCDSSLIQGETITPPSSATNSKQSYTQFLPTRYGAYHQQYLIDGKIVCVGVLDILPHCVSSVYFYYDPEYSFLSLGTLSSLFEISYVRKVLAQWNPEVIYYYMGFYIHSCSKMRYKSQYDPSFLLCPETYEWINVSKCVPKLDAAKYSRLDSDTPTTKDSVSQAQEEADLNTVLVLYKQQAMPYRVLVDIRRRGKPWHNGINDKSEVNEYSGLLGTALAQKMLLYRSS